ncbi:glycosyltransferase family 2 protein [Telluribacter sp. SYSU D00476]|uniref:glycosyltransferase family 2 protein n=1 Tax=Telluribacter sp. SYSU D00476 TaxID=2811430 RepID=UPI001FF2333C|nr:glycosyltransferase family 2 protein [Telluribacter sp. SYSU D00476]
MIDISVLILTKNEEQDLPACLDSVSWCDDLHVFDSFSQDRTVEIAVRAGAKVTQREFDSYASQRNAALDNLDFKYPWILILDADERIPESLPVLLNKHISRASLNVSGFRIRRRDFLYNSWLKHAQISPFYIRLVRKGKARYHRDINEVLEVDGVVEDIDGFFDHYPFSKGINHWLSKHNQYSTMEAKRWLEEQNGLTTFSLQKALFSKDFNEKRFHQKGIFYKLPGRPILKWLYMILYRRAFLDGRAGIIYATLQAIYEYFIVLKAKEKMHFDSLNNTNKAVKPLKYS